MNLERVWPRTETVSVPAQRKTSTGSGLSAGVVSRILLGCKEDLFAKGL